MHSQLRIIVDPPKPASFNMAADRYLLQSSAASTDITIRFYEWLKPTITLGYMQDSSQIIDFESLKSINGEWIRRITGGRGVLHYNDLTYSIIFPKTATLLGNSISESYSIISQCLMLGLSNAGIPCEAEDSDLDAHVERTRIQLPCFLSPNRNEILCKGKKLIGSAQKRTEHGVLQHGSIPFTNDFRNLPDYCNLDESQKNTQIKMLESKCTCINELNATLTKNELIEFLKKGFSEILQVSLFNDSWQDNELASIKNIADANSVF
jgi:lipoate-protein ligase A